MIVAVMRHAAFVVAFCASAALGGCGDADEGGTGGNAAFAGDAGLFDGAPVTEGTSGGFAPKPIIAPPRQDMDAGDDDASVPETDAATDASSACGNGTLEVGEACDWASDPCCDTACDGPRSATHVCRPKSGACDAEETCDGTTFACPADDLEPALTVCRAQAGACDVAELCNGTSAACPSDVQATDGTPCDLPSPSAQGAAVCSAGSCCPGVTRNDGTGCGLPPEQNVVFLGSGPVPNGAFGGLANGDTHCQMLAAGANLRGTFHAWLSESGTSAIARVSDGPYVDVAGRVIAPSAGELVDGTIDVPIEMLELALVAAPSTVYTGTLVDGTAAATHCAAWTDGAGQGMVGNSGQTGSTWTQSTVGTCSDPARLYCFQDDCPGRPSVDFMNDPEHCGKCGNRCSGTCVFGECQGLVFVTSTTYAGNLLGGLAGGGLADGDQICNTAAQDATPNALPGLYQAWLSTAGKDAAGRILDQPYLRPDGTLVVSSLAQLLAPALEAPIAIDEDGATTTATYVWTGTKDDGTAATAAPCDDWTATVGTTAAGTLGATGTGWSGGNSVLCGTQLPLFCFQVGPVAP